MHINCPPTAILSTLVYLWLKELVISERIPGVEERMLYQVQHASSTKHVISFSLPHNEYFSAIVMHYIVIRVSSPGNQLK